MAKDSRRGTLEAYATETVLRIAFCSEANFSGWADSRGVELEISRIMYPAPRTEADQQTGGIFHYGNRCFLQCVEGPRQAVEFIFEKTRNDARHKNSVLLSVEPISERMFPENSMSYVGMRQHLIELLQRHGISGFNPYRITPEIFEQFLQMYLERQRR